MRGWDEPIMLSISCCNSVLQVGWTWLGINTLLTLVLSLYLSIVINFYILAFDIDVDIFALSSYDPRP